MTDEDNYVEEPKELMTREEALAAGGIDLNNLPKQTHRWVDRGLVLSCEGAGHPNHRSFKRQPMKQ